MYGRVDGPTLRLCDRSDPTSLAEEVEAIRSATWSVSGLRRTGAAAR